MDIRKRVRMRKYMRKYREEHPDYCQKVREQMRSQTRKGTHTPIIRSYKHVSTMIRGNHVLLKAPYKRIKPTECELCGEERAHLHYHHWDNENPSIGLWLCYRCHMFAERADALTDWYFELKEKAEREVLEAMRKEEESMIHMQELQERLNII